MLPCECCQTGQYRAQTLFKTLSGSEQSCCCWTSLQQTKRAHERTSAGRCTRHAALHASTVSPMIARLPSAPGRAAAASASRTQAGVSLHIDPRSRATRASGRCGKVCLRSLKVDLAGDVAWLSWDALVEGDTWCLTTTTRRFPTPCIRHVHAGSYNRLQPATCQRSFGEAAVTAARSSAEPLWSTCIVPDGTTSLAAKTELPFPVSDAADRRTPQLVSCTSVGRPLAPVRRASPGE